MNYKQFSTLFTTAILLLSTIVVAQPHNLVTLQGNFVPILITDVTADDTETIIIQYLGTVNDPARLHWAFFNSDCDEFSAFTEDVTSFEIVSLEDIGPFPPGDAKLVIWVEDVAGINQLNEPILGYKYINGQTSIKTLAGVTVPNPAIPVGGIINQAPLPPVGVQTPLNFDGIEYGLLPKNFIHHQLLTTPPTTADAFNRLAINVFEPGPKALDTRNLNDIEEFDIQSIPNTNCVSIAELFGAPFDFTNIGGGISQGLPPGASVTNTGVGIVRTTENSGALFAEAMLTDSVVGPASMQCRSTVVSPSRYCMKLTWS